MANGEELKSEIGIEFGDWRLIPVDSINWELCHRRASSRGKQRGKVSWYREGKFFDCYSLGGAIRYAADHEMKARCGKVMSLADAMDEHMRIVKEMCDEVSKAAATTLKPSTPRKK